MTSDAASLPRASRAFVWIWLPGSVKPVVAGVITPAGDRYDFTYGRSYLARKDAIPIFDPELPLGRGPIPPAPDLKMAGCLRDGAPDAWGRRVILNRLFGVKGDAIDVDAVDELNYLLRSGSDRVGALDFQASSSAYEPRVGAVATLEELQTIANRVEEGVPVTPELERALFHGTSLGGARPKAAVETPDAKFIAKFSSSNDITNVVKGEFVAMRLAERVGIHVAKTRLQKAAGKDVLLVERFDRDKVAIGWTRRSMISALTLQGLDEMFTRYASYGAFAEIVRARFSDPRKTLHELFRRLVFNVLCGNTDDHARNHAAFWDGRTLNLTPAYDICPQPRSGREANQAMDIVGTRRDSTLAACLAGAHQFQLNDAQARSIVKDLVESTIRHFDSVAEEAQLTEIEHRQLWRRAFLNPFAFQDAPEPIASLEPA